jgi:hypothetical protein
MAEATSSWLSPSGTYEPRPAQAPPRAPLPPNVVRARQVGEDPAPTPPADVAPSAPPPPQAPSEAQARETLAGAQRVRRDADEALTQAEGALTNAQALLKDKQAAVAEFDGLAAGLIADAVAATREGRTTNLPHDRIAAREVALTERSTAERVVEVLRTELETARAAASKASTHHEHAVRALLLCEASKVGEKYLEAQRAADALAATCSGVWAVLTDARGMVSGVFVTPPPVEAARLHTRFRTAVDQWSAFAEALRVDATATVEIKIEPLPPVAVRKMDNSKPPSI